MANSRIYLNGVPTDPIEIYNNIVAHKYTKDQELILGTNLMENSISFFDLSWSIAQSAYDVYGKGKVSDYYNEQTFKMANAILGVKKANKVKIGMKIISESIVNNICENYYHLGLTVASGQNNSGKHYNTVSLGIQRARLEKALKNIIINGENSLNTGFWQWADIDITKIVDGDAFYDSDGSEEITGSLVIHSVDDIVNQVLALVPQYDKILKNFQSPQYASANIAAVRSANVAYNKENQKFDKALRAKHTAIKEAERAAKKAEQLKQRAIREAKKQQKKLERQRKHQEMLKKRNAKATKAARAGKSLQPEHNPELKAKLAKQKQRKQERAAKRKQERLTKQKEQKK